MTVNAQALTTIRSDTDVTVQRIDMDGANKIRLLRLGICEGRNVRVAQVGDPLIIVAVGSRIGVSRRLAQNIYVRVAE